MMKSTRQGTGCFVSEPSSITDRWPTLHIKRSSNSENSRAVKCLTGSGSPWATACGLGVIYHHYVPTPELASADTVDCFDLLAVQGTLKSLFQHHSSKASILQCSAFFMVQLSHPYMTTGKAIALTIWTFVSNVMSLLRGKQ